MLLSSKYGFSSAFVQVVFRLPNLLRKVEIIPRLDPDAGLLAVGDCLHVGHFLLHPRDRARPYLAHERLRDFRIGRHGVGHAQVRVTWIPEQCRALRAEFHDSGNRRFRVAGIAVVAATLELLPYHFAQVAAR